MEDLSERERRDFNKVYLKLNISKMYDEDRVCHSCFKIENHGNFVILNIPSDIKDAKTGRAKKIRTIHSVHYVNSPVKVKNYIVEDIAQGETQKEAIYNLLLKLEDKPNNYYH